MASQRHSWSVDQSQEPICAPAPRTLIGCALKTFDGTRRILDTIIFSLPATFEFSMLLLMTFFVYAAIGMALFYNVADLRSVSRGWLV